jgi:hypothetical protein
MVRALSSGCHRSAAEALPGQTRPISSSSVTALREDAPIMDRKIGRAEFSEIFGPLFSRPSSNKALKVDLAGRCVNHLALLLELRNQSAA